MSTIYGRWLLSIGYRNTALARVPHLLKKGAKLEKSRGIPPLKSPDFAYRAPENAILSDIIHIKQQHKSV